jgi:hypothetical protein
LCLSSGFVYLPFELYLIAIDRNYKLIILVYKEKFKQKLWLEDSSVDAGVVSLVSSKENVISEEKRKRREIHFSPLSFAYTNALS